jgi:hypothetical protein
MMHHVPQPGLTVPAVAGPVERGVRPHRAARRGAVGAWSDKLHRSRFLVAVAVLRRCEPPGA